MALALCGACDERDPCRGSLKEGESFEVEIVEKWDKDSQYAFQAESSDLNLPSCEADDVKVGKSYAWNIDDTSRSGHDNGCYNALCPDDFPTQSKGLSSRQTLGDDGASYSCTSPDRIASIDGCDVGRFVGLIHADLKVDLFDQPKVGKKPPAVLLRRLLFGKGNPELHCEEPMAVFPDETMISAEAWHCADAWVVRLKKK